MLDRLSSATVTIQVNLRDGRIKVVGFIGESFPHPLFLLVQLCKGPVPYVLLTSLKSSRGLIFAPTAFTEFPESNFRPYIGFITEK